MNETFQRNDKMVLGWFAALVMLCFTMLSSSAWALDLDHEIKRQETDSAQILGTLGRGRALNAHTSGDTHRKVQVQMLRKKSGKGCKGR